MNRKLLLTGIEELNEREDPIPEAPSNGVVVKVCYAGLCHTDLHIYHQPGTIPPETFPIVLGHEISGIVHSVGEGHSKELEHFSPGDRVVAFTWGGCLKCAACRAGYNTICSNKFCPEAETFGIFCDGGYQEYLTILDPWRLVRIPKDVDLALAATVPCSGITAINAIEICGRHIERAIDIKRYANVLGFGAGALCLWMVEIVKVKYSDKVKVCVVDIKEEKLNDALAKGCDLTLCVPREGNIEKVSGDIRKQFGDEGVDAAIDFVTSATSQHYIFNSLADGGTQVYVGILESKMSPLGTMELIDRQNSLQGCYAGTKNHVVQVLEMIANGKVKGPPLSIIQFEDIEKTMKGILAGQPYRGRYVVEVCKS